MSVGIIGMSLLGIATAASLAKMGQQVVCADMDEELVSAVRELDFPGYEADMEKNVREAQDSGNLKFSEHIRGVVKDCNIIFITCEVPETDGELPSLRFVREIARSIASHMEGPKTVVLRSIVPPGSAAAVAGYMEEIMAEREDKHSFEVLLSPSFSRPGQRFKEMLRPKYILIGAEDETKAEPLKALYRSLGFLDNRISVVPLREAELASYAKSSLLALKNAYVNELAVLCDRMDINLEAVTKIMGKDPGISARNLMPNPGFGGSDMPKGLRTMMRLAEENGASMVLAQSALRANDNQKSWCVKKIGEILGGLEGKVIGILGLAQDHGSDDLREAPSLDIIHGLAAGGAELRIYNKSGYQQAKWRLFKEKEAVTFAEDIYDAAQGADALVVLTRWPNTRATDEARLHAAMRGDVLIDFQNLFAGRREIRALFDYHSFGLK
ncbi:MAG: nucleotide sugar dehydrogenase [Eubacterium sp.]|nr:nucleotide sugar dehydrogenase [Eubacterium sp.]